MLSTRWNRLGSNEVERLHQEMNQLFGRFAFPPSTAPILGVAYPQLNMWEDNDHVYVEAELPGMQESDLEIYVTGGNTLTIQGQRKQCQAEGVWHRQERGFGKFSRALTLPFEVDADRVEAHFDNGVLQLTLPKSETARPRRITVTA